MSTNMDAAPHDSGSWKIFATESHYDVKKTSQHGAERQVRIRHNKQCQIFQYRPHILWRRYWIFATELRGAEQQVWIHHIFYLFFNFFIH